MAEVSKFNWNYQQAIAGNPDAIEYMYEYVNANYKYANQLLYKLEREKIINHTYRITADFLQEEMGTWKARFNLSMLTDENVADVAKEFLALAASVWIIAQAMKSISDMPLDKMFLSAVSLCPIPALLIKPV